MEGLAWLVIKLAALLALTGVAFFALGWWLRGRQAPLCAETPESEETPAIEEAPAIERVPEHAAITARDLEQFKLALLAAESSKDSLMGELASTRSRLAEAEDEISNLRAAPPPAVSAEISEELILQSAPAAKKAAKPRAPRKPRAKKSKE